MLWLSNGHSRVGDRYATATSDLARRCRWRRGLGRLWVAWALAAVLGASDCSPGHGPRPGGPPDTLQVAETDAEQAVALVPGQILRLNLAANPSTGYTWQVTTLPACLAADGTPGFTPRAVPAGTVGAGGTMTFAFRAVAAGNGRLELSYRRSWETQAPPVRRFALNVSVPRAAP
jgi:inhibitor of cysteine peptidase